jgi:hypothetical protein
MRLAIIPRDKNFLVSTVLLQVVTFQQGNLKAIAFPVGKSFISSSQKPNAFTYNHLNWHDLLVYVLNMCKLPMQPEDRASPDSHKVKPF